MKNKATVEMATACQKSGTWEVRKKGSFHEVHSAREKICDVELNIDDSDDYHERCASNARLIASAPDLLAALEKITDYAEIYLRHSVDGSIGANMLSEARAAIAKAKGAQS